MEDNPNQHSSRPAARTEFARRLRELRVVRGFRTARSLARALDIDENRYTRYERAEVEPDLELLIRICSVLSVTPNDLLGADKLPAPTGTEPAHGPLAETGAPYTVAGDTARQGALQMQFIGWEICALVAELRQPRETRDTTTSAAPLAFLQIVTALQQELDRLPFDFIRQIVHEPAVVEAPADKVRKLEALIDRLTASMAGSADKRT